MKAYTTKNIMSKPKILLLLTGGTIAMKVDPALNAIAPTKTPKDSLSLINGLKDYYKIDYKYIENLDSTNIQPKHWVNLAKTIYKEYDKYDGFVITHGTDTMSYTASALSFALLNIGKPVVLTGSQLPPDSLGSDAKNNLINAVRVASMDIGEVVIVFGTKIIRGNRSSKQSESDLNAFWSPIYPILGNIRAEIDLLNFHKKRDANKKPELHAEFSEDVCVFTVTPGIKPKYFEILLKDGIKGFILAGFGAGNVPNKDNSFVPCIAQALKSNIPVVIASQCLAGTAKMLMYETGVTALKAGGISASDMTLEATVTKLMWTLTRTKNLREVRKIIHKDTAGELTEQSKLKELMGN